MQDLYNRVRPREFGQMITTSSFLKNIDELVKDTIDGKPGLPHVMIFFSNTVPGLGKTTCARILAVKLNPTIGNEEAENIYRGLDSIICTEVNATDMKKPDVAALISNMMGIKYEMFGYRYVYIINEAHKLTDDSVQLMLSLEDLPDNVYVIMTTTETFRIRQDLLSRIRTYTFKPPADDVLVKLLTDILVKYKDEFPYSRKYDILSDQNLMTDIAMMSMGSIRKAIVLLEGYMTNGEFDNPDDVAESRTDIHRVFFNDFLQLWVDIIPAQIHKRTSWSDIARKYSSITRSRGGRAGIASDDFRLGLLACIQRKLVSESAIEAGLGFEESYVYSVLEKYLADFLIQPPVINLTVRLHMAFMEIVLYREKNPELFVTPS